MNVERQTTKTAGGNSAPADALFMNGVQSVGVSSSFPWEPMLDVGRSQKTFARYNKQEFTINIERILADGETFFYNTTSKYSDGQTALKMYRDTHILNSLNIGIDGFGDSLRNYDIVLIYAPDRFDYLGGGTGGDPDVNKYMATQYRCCLLTNVSYSIPIQGPVKETLTFTTKIANQIDASSSSWAALSVPGGSRTGDTIKRQDIDVENSVFPTEVNRMFDLGNSKDGKTILGLQSIEIDASISYTDIMDVGQWRGSNLTGASPDTGSTALRAQQNLFRQVVLPIDITANFNGIVRSQYRAQPPAYQAFELTDTTFSAADGSETTTTERYAANREIMIIAEKTATPKFYHWILGKKNYLESMDFSGGDTGGSNVTATLSYKNTANDFVLVKHDSRITSNNIDPGDTIF